MWEGALCFSFNLGKVFLQGATISPLQPKNLDYSLLWESGILLIRLSQVFRQGAIMPPLHPIFGFVIIEGRGIILLLPISQRISSGCHHASPSPLFSNFHYCGTGVLCFCFYLAKVFLQGATFPPLHPIVWGEVLLWEGGIMLPLRLSQRISSGCHHATPKQKNLVLSLLWEEALCFCFGLAKVFLQGATMPPLHPHFFGSVIIVGSGYYASAST